MVIIQKDILNSEQTVDHQIVTLTTCCILQSVRLLKTKYAHKKLNISV